MTYAIAAVGLSFYISRFPETKCGSGRCDILGASHQVKRSIIFEIYGRDVFKK